VNNLMHRHRCDFIAQELLGNPPEGDAMAKLNARKTMSISFANKVAMVTGGASGIGSATVELLCALGARVAILDRDEEHGRSLTQRLVARGFPVSFHACEISSPAAVQSAVEAAVQSHGALHVLVHSAGIQRYGNVVSTSIEVWREIFAVHVDGCFHALRFALPHIVAAGGGAVVIVGSVQSVTAIARSAAYVAAKHALAGLTRAVALDFAESNVRANCIMPGAVDTPMLHWAANLAPDPQAVLEASARAHPLGRIAQPIEIARSIAFLASDWASFITGSTLAVDGGMLVPTGGMGFKDSGVGSASQQ
jgi:NAD(P)-dependent dehydrogenase (short-subunit alcohol dehydrogenase family)